MKNEDITILASLQTGSKQYSKPVLEIINLKEDSIRGKNVTLGNFEGVNSTVSGGQVGAPPPGVPYGPS